MHVIEKKILVQDLNSSKGFLGAIVKVLQSAEIEVNIDIDFKQLGIYSDEACEGLKKRMETAKETFRKANEAGIENRNIYEYVTYLSNLQNGTSI